MFALTTSVVKVKPSLTIYLEKSGQKITLDLQEAKALIKSLTDFVQNDSHYAKTSRGKKADKQRKSNVPSLTETKKQEIISHINKQLSAKPRTLSNLLKGISYVPNHLPLIRKLVEDQPNISKQIVGKRTFYRSSNGSKSEKSRKDIAATAA